MNEINPPAPELVKGQSVRFVMKERCWHGAVIVFDDAQATINRHRASPDRPLLVEVEGKNPTPEQLAVLANVWHTLSNHFTFTVASFSDELLPHASVILGRLEIPPAA